MPFKTCPECGKGVREIDPKCWNCEYNFDTGGRPWGAKRWDQRSAKAPDTVRCPRCKSSSIHAEKRGWKLTTGFLGSSKIVITCLNCGNKFKPGRGG